MFLAAKIIDSFLDETLAEKLSQYKHLVNRADQELCSPTQGFSFYRADTRLIDAVEVRLFL